MFNFFIRVIVYSFFPYIVSQLAIVVIPILANKDYEPLDYLNRNLISSSIALTLGSSFYLRKTLGFFNCLFRGAGFSFLLIACFELFYLALCSLSDYLMSKFDDFIRDRYNILAKDYKANTNIQNFIAFVLTIIYVIAYCILYYLFEL